MNDCIFCKIVAGEIPSTVLYEDEDVLVFMDIGPIIKGHALVISKTHYDPVTQTPDEIVARLHTVAKRVAQAPMNGFCGDGGNIMQNNGKASGQEVEHIHVHVIPRYESDGHRWNWNAKQYEDMNEMAQLAGKIRDSLQ